MTLQGNTLFAGDSITVGLKPFVKVDGEKMEAAKGGQSSAQLLAMLKTPEAQAQLARAQNMVVLIGTNDIGGGASIPTLAQTIMDIWGLAKSRGIRVYAMTVPPVKGYTGFRDFGAVNARRKALNVVLEKAAAAGAADHLIDLSALLADPADPDRLATKHDGGDHLHPRKDTMGALLSTALVSSAVSVRPGAIVPTGTPFPWATVFLLVGIAVGGTILLARKDSLGSSFASRVLH